MYFVAQRHLVSVPGPDRFSSLLTCLTLLLTTSFAKLRVKSLSLDRLEAEYMYLHSHDLQQFPHKIAFR